MLVHMHAVKELHNALVIDTYPSTVNENRIKKNIDIVLSLNGNEQAFNYKLMILFFLQKNKNPPHKTKHHLNLFST